MLHYLKEIVINNRNKSMEFLRKNLIYISVAIVVILAIFKFISPAPVAQEYSSDKVNLYFFYGDGCPHCAKEEILLDELENKYPEINIYRYETWYDSENAQVLDHLRSEMDFRAGVPVLIVGEEVVVGYGSYESTGKKIEKLVTEHIETGCIDIVAPLVGLDEEDANLSGEKTCEHTCDQKEGECEHDCGCSADLDNSDYEAPKDSINVPFVGDVNLNSLALPTFTVVIAAADGFNPCAMWVLLFLINLLIGLNDKRKVWIYGMTFILTSAIVYYFLVFTWLQIFLLIGLIVWVRLLVGLFAVGTGAYHIKDYWENMDGGCKVTDNEKRQKIFTRLREIVQRKQVVFALGGIILLATAVNMVELLCSAGFPQTFTQVLAMKNLGFWENQMYLLLYIVVFMLDDLLIFSLAVKTMQLKGISAKYSRYSGLVGGILILLIGVLLILKPEWIMFG